MPRIAEVRDAAEPSSDEQRARHVRMLEAAAELGTEKELSRVQMHEVAKRAGVAIGSFTPAGRVLRAPVYCSGDGGC